MVTNLYFRTYGEFEQYAIEEQIIPEFRESFNRYLNGGAVAEAELEYLHSKKVHVWIRGSRAWPMSCESKHV